MSYICEYVRKPFEKSEKVKIACWQPALLYMFQILNNLQIGKISHKMFNIKKTPYLGGFSHITPAAKEGQVAYDRDVFVRQRHGSNFYFVVIHILWARKNLKLTEKLIKQKNMHLRNLFYI